MMYFRAIGLAASLVILAVFIIFQGASVGANIWLSIWTNDKQLANISQANTTEYQDRNYMFLGIYAVFGVIQGSNISHLKEIGVGMLCSKEFLLKKTETTF